MTTPPRRSVPPLPSRPLDVEPPTERFAASRVTMAKWRLGGALSLVAVLTLFCGGGSTGLSAAGTVVATGSTPLKWHSSPLWKEVDRLVDEQKLEEAAKQLRAIRAAAAKSGNEAEQAAALIREAAMRNALHGYETAVGLLREQKWPKGALERAALDLFYAHTLVGYYNAYSWEIQQRETVASDKGKLPVNLKIATKDQLYAEAQRSYQRVWTQREALGREPITALAEVLSPNDYPAGVRSTLRDAVTYLGVELLANSSLWRPEQSNEVYRLELKSLMRQPLMGRPVQLDDGGRHPLVRAIGALDDLEQWHRAGNRVEAALEAQLERLRRLYGAFTQPEERQAVRTQLAKQLPEVRQVAWWAMAQVQLAEWLRDDGQLVQAHRLAKECAAAYPKTVGGLRCVHLVKTIEAPDYQLAAMANDGPSKRSVLVTHKNLPKLYWRAYPVELQGRIVRANGGDLNLSYDEVRALVRTGKPTASWTLELPPTPDYQSHKTFVTPPLQDKGLFVLVASAKADFAEQGNRVLAVHLLQTELALVVHSVEAVVRPGSGALGWEVTVLDASKGQPVSGAAVHLYERNWGKPQVLVGEAKSDGNGRALVKPKGSRGQSHFIVAEKGGDLVVDGNWLWNSGGSSAPTESTSTLIYTDRSVYRPGQTIRWKALAYRGRSELGQFKVAPGVALTITLYDGNNQEVAHRAVTTNGYGSAAGELVIPTGRLLGGWQLSSSIGGNAVVRVEEYKRPTFEMSLRDPKEPMRLNRPAKLVGEAKYYFGLPVTRGQVKWHITRESVYPYWWSWWGGGVSGGGEQTVAAGTSPLKGDGTFDVAFTPQADERGNKELTYRYEVSAELTDEGGETRSAERSFRLGLVSVETTLSSEATFWVEREAAELTARRASLDGIPRAGNGSWRLVALQQPAVPLLPAELPAGPGEGGPAAVPTNTSGVATPPYVTPGDRQRARWETSYSVESQLVRWKDGAEQAHGALTHDAKGEAKIALPALAPGAYRLRYDTVDDFGAHATAQKELLVVSKSGTTPLALPLVLQAQRFSVDVGQKARLLVHTGYVGQPLTLELYRAGVRIEQRRVVGGTSSLIELPMDEAMRGGFGVVVSTIRDHQYLTLNSSLFVPWDNKQLTVELTTFRDKLRPGTKETWRVAVKSAIKGRPATAVAAELLAYMYDRSLDVFASHSPPSPLSLYPNRSGVAWAHSTLGGSVSGLWILDQDFAPLPSYPSLSADRIVEIDGYGIGGMGVRGGYGGMRRSLRMKASAMEERDEAKPAAAPAPMAKMADVDHDAVADKKDVGASKNEMAKPLQTVGSAAGAAKSPEPVRSNFAETAFWIPQLTTAADGTAALEFTVPDSVTSWNVWVHAVTKELASGSTHRESRSVKELMVRPYLPRFFREGDRAELKVVVNNASERELKGELVLTIADASGGDLASAFGLKTARQPFTVAAGRSANVTYPVSAPTRLGDAVFEVRGTTEGLSDGERRAVPVLPSRMHLVQSRFVTLRDVDKRAMTFDDLAKGKEGDPSLLNESLVVTLDAQLFFTVLSALPYLVTYPYECAEQLLNRFVSTGIVTSVFRKYPAVAAMAKEMAAQRKTQLDTWDRGGVSDPNRTMALEESPWVEEAKGGRSSDNDGGTMRRVLDPEIARAERESSLAKLAKMQLPNGAFPWFPGGPPSPYITLYLMYGFAKAAEFEVDIPKPLVNRGWRYLASVFRADYVANMIHHDCCWEFLTFLNFTASSYPDDSWVAGALTPAERKQILDFTFGKWKRHSPQLKGMLALTLKRMGRPKDAELVFASVMDSAKTEKDRGTYWAPEDRSWLWYNDTIETQAFALRTLTELTPGDSRKDGLVLWLLLNKKLNQWKSTRATAEVLYALVHYMEKDGSLGVREAANVSVGTHKETFTFEPNRYAGKAQLVLRGAEVDALAKPGAATVTVDKQSKGVMFASSTWHFSTEKLPEAERGDFFQVQRRYFKREQVGKEIVLKPLAGPGVAGGGSAKGGESINVGDEIEVQLSLRVKHEAEFVHLRDPRAAGAEPVSQTSGYRWNLGIGWFEEVRDSGANFFFEKLPVGEYTFKYRVRANMAGTFRVGPATVQSMYAPEFNAYSTGQQLVVGAAR